MKSIGDYETGRPENLIRQNLGYFRSIFKNSLEGVLLAIPDSGEVLYANPAALEMLQMTENEACQAGRNKIVVWDNAFENVMEERKKHGRWRGEISYRRKDGSTFPVELSSSYFSAPDGTMLLSISFRDITERRRWEEALKESEEKYRAVVEYSNDGIIMIQDGIIKYANPHMAELDGSAPGQLIGTPIEDHIDPEDVQRITEHYRKRIAGEAVPNMYEARLRRRDGRRAYAELNAGVTRYQGKPAVLAVIRDITERKEMEGALRESEERFRKLFHTLPLGVALIDPKTLHFVMFNDAMATDLGFTPSEFSKVNLTDLEVLHDRSSIQMNHAKMLRGERLQFESQLRHKTLGPRDFLVTATGVAMGGRKLVLSIKADITDRKRAEEALRIAREELETRVEERTAELEHDRQLLQRIIDNIPVMLTFYKMSGEVVFLNKEVERVTGWSLEDLAHIDAMAEAYPDPEYRKEVWDFMANPGPYWKDIRMRRKDGSFVDTRWMNVKLSDESQIGIGLDISGQLELEEQLRHSQKMEALGAMAGGVAHDFNNILAAVIGFGEMAKEELPEGSPERHYVEQVLKAGLRGRDLVRQMLTFSRKNGEGRKAMKLSDAIQEAIKLIRASIPTTITIKLDVENDTGIILADHTQIQQIIVNLCNNAADAMAETGGTLTMQLSNFKVSKNRRLGGLAPGPYVRLIVSDTGKGMDRQVLERVFEPFFTTKEPGKGTGLGLSIVHGIVANYGGEIIAESRPGQGTAFTLFFPHLQEKPAEQDEETILAPGGGGERVLLVDDEKDLVELTTKMLQALGYHVTGKTNSRETLETFKNDPSSFDLIISDQTMPEMTGIQLSRELKTVKDIPFILTTGYSQMVNAESAREAGISAFVMKPLTKSELACTIRKVLDKKKLKRRG